MKRIILYLFIFAGLVSCNNFKTDFDDYLYTSGFFPYQYPIRTLVLGDYIYDNENDNAHKFLASVAIGGVYENTKDREFQIQLDESLCDNLTFTAGGKAVLPMPSTYYSLSSTNKILIPKGKMNGGVTVQLTDAFFNDPLAISTTYVIPLKLVGSTDVDTILSGYSLYPSPDLTDAALWSIVPKNYTLFAVKYVNEFHGNYFQYGKYKVNGGTETTYSAKYVEQNSVVKLTTTGRYQVSLRVSLRATGVMTGNLDMLLNFSGDNCTITAPAGSAYTITGTGQFKTKEYNWGNKDRDGIVLNYTVTNGANTYEASDVLVSRDRAIVMETYSPVYN